MNLVKLCHLLTLDRQAYLQAQFVPFGFGIGTVSLGVDIGTLPLGAGIGVA